MALIPVFVPDGSATTQAFTTSTSEIDPAGAYEVKANNTGAAVATLPTPVAKHTKLKDSNDQIIDPSVVYGQYIKLSIATLRTSWTVTYYDASEGASYEATFNNVADELVLVAVPVSGDQLGGYMVVENNSVSLAAA